MTLCSAQTSVCVNLNMHEPLTPILHTMAQVFNCLPVFLFPRLLVHLIRYTLRAIHAFLQFCVMRPVGVGGFYQILHRLS